MINFCHIAPVSYLPLVGNKPTHLLLAHLVEENEEYRTFYQTLKRDNPSVFYHLDNSAFEMFKRGEPMYDSQRLIEMGRLVGADSVVLSDYPKQPAYKTINAAIDLIPKFKEAGFQTFFCPQSELGDLEGLIQSFTWAINNPEIDFIGVSILNCPIGLGVNEQKFGDQDRDEGYRMQRYLSRWRILEILQQRNLIGPKTVRRFHCLGMTDGPREIDLVRQYHQHIYSWDSSTAIWHGIHKIQYDDSPTGLRFGKYEEEVDFDIDRSTDVDVNRTIDYNISMIDRMCGA